MARIGIYGGTFNPPHIGHIRAADCALSRLALDKLLLIPDRIAPHKAMPAGTPNPNQRLNMVRIGAESIHDSRVEVTDMELHREGPSYTYQTVEQLRSLYPGDEFYLLMGTDMFLSFQNWKNAEQIWNAVTLAVFCRGERGEAEKILQHKA